jgi:hypothetical protein
MELQTMMMMMMMMMMMIMRVVLVKKDSFSLCMHWPVVPGNTTF